MDLEMFLSDDKMDEKQDRERVSTKRATMSALEFVAYQLQIQEDTIVYVVQEYIFDLNCAIENEQ